jgi:hypothetical protein
MKVSLAEAQSLYDESKSEVVYVDRLLEAWAWCGRNTSMPRLSTHCSLAHVIVSKPEPGSVVAARARSLDLDDAQFALIDRAVCRLPATLKKIVLSEYWHGGQQSAKAKHLNLSRTDYRGRLAAAQWAVYILLLPDIEQWRSMHGG